MIRTYTNGSHAIDLSSVSHDCVRILVIVIIVLQLKYSPIDGREYCHTEQFTASCPDGQLILVTAARYGRMSVGRCVKTNFGFIGCSKVVTQQVHQRCSGRPSCAIRIPEPILDQTKPCNEDLKSYLDVNYTCIKVSVPSEGDGCQLKSEREEFSGYLSNRLPLFASSRICGSKDSPWTIAVLSGQRINLTLHDFSTTTFPPRQGHGGGGGGGGGQTTLCDLYALVQETESASVTNICGSGLVQQLHVYTSAGSSLRVTLIPRKVNSTANFLISYEAVGCPDFQTPPNAWTQRVGEEGADGEEVTVGCIASDNVWQVICNGNRWDGTPGNCSTVSSTNARREDGMSSLSIGASILTILGVSMTIGIIVLLIGLFYMRSKRIGSVIGQELAMRDLKPLNAATAVYDTTVVYARNKAFEPVRVNIVRPPGAKGTGGCGAVAAAADPCTEYEYMWDCPSGVAAAAAAALPPPRGGVPSTATMVKRIDNGPDLLKITSSCAAASTHPPPPPAAVVLSPAASSSSSSSSSADHRGPSGRAVTLPKKEMGRRFERQTGTLGRGSSRNDATIRKAETAAFNRPTTTTSPRLGHRSTEEEPKKPPHPPHLPSLHSCSAAVVDRKTGGADRDDLNDVRGVGCPLRADEVLRKRAIPLPDAPPPISIRQKSTK